MPITRPWSGKLQPPEPPPVLIYFVTRNQRLGSLVKMRVSRQDLDLVTFKAGLHMMQTIRRLPAHLVIISEHSQENSLSLARQVRQALGPSAGIIWIAATVSQQRVLQAVKAGVNRIVIFPFTLPALMEQIAACCSRFGVAIGTSAEGPAEVGDGLVGRDALMEQLSRVATINTVPPALQRVTDITGGSEGAASDLEDRSLVLVQALMEVISIEQQTLGFDRLEFWKASLATALFSREIARHSGAAKPEEAFLAGLLADFGKLILDEHLNSRFETAICLAHEENLRLRDAERRGMELDHLDVGGMTLEQWRLPSHVTQAVRAHEEVDKIQALPDEARSLAGCLCLGKWLGLAMGMGDHGDAILDYSPATLFEEINIAGWMTHENLQPLIEELNDMLLPFNVRVRSPFEGEERPEVRFFEFDALPVSILELLIMRAGGEPVRLETIEQVDGEFAKEPVVVHATDLERLKQVARELNWNERPYLFFAPPVGDDADESGDWPPVGKCKYVEFPLNVRRVSQLILDTIQK